MNDDILDSAQVAELFNVSAATVRNWARGGIVPCVKRPSGRAFLFRREDIERLLEPAPEVFR